MCFWDQFRSADMIDRDPRDNIAKRERYARQMAARMEVEKARTPSLPTVSILEKDLGLTNADYYAGKAAQAAAGLS